MIQWFLWVYWRYDCAGPEDGSVEFCVGWEKIYCLVHDYSNSSALALELLQSCS